MYGEGAVVRKQTTSPAVHVQLTGFLESGSNWIHLMDFGFLNKKMDFFILASCSTLWGITS